MTAHCCICGADAVAAAHSAWVAGALSVAIYLDADDSHTWRYYCGACLADNLDPVTVVERIERDR